MLIPERAALFVWITEGYIVSLFTSTLFLTVFFSAGSVCRFAERRKKAKTEKGSEYGGYTSFLGNRESPFIASFAFVVRQPPAADHKYKAGDPHP